MRFCCFSVFAGGQGKFAVLICTIFFFFSFSIHSNMYRTFHFHSAFDFIRLMWALGHLKTSKISNFQRSSTNVLIWGNSNPMYFIGQNWLNITFIVAAIANHRRVFFLVTCLFICLSVLVQILRCHLIIYCFLVCLHQLFGCIVYRFEQNKSFRFVS